jgi:hypothetical protein
MPVDTFVSSKKCFDCARWRKCYTCGERRLITEFPQQTSKGCKDCRNSGRAKINKLNNNKRMYSEKKEEILSHNKAWKKTNAVRYRSQQREYKNKKRREQRDRVLSYYGGRCACCGEVEPVFLTIDHINGNGALHRRMINKADMWKWLDQQGYPQGYQLLCFNCNAGKYRNGGTCPHESTREISKWSAVAE